jgi:hypothetical protein
MLVFSSTDLIFSDALCVFASNSNYHYALLQSNIHEVWLRHNASTIRTDIRYTPSDCFDNFPFPQDPLLEIQKQAEHVGAEYHDYREKIMPTRQIGLTETYNLFHNPACTDADIRRLRELHAEMDRAILICYRWDDLDPQHNFYQNERGQTRFTVSPSVRRETLRRLLELNLKIYENEQSTK